MFFVLGNNWFGFILKVKFFVWGILSLGLINIYMIYGKIIVNEEWILFVNVWKFFVFVIEIIFNIGRFVVDIINFINEI